MNEETQTQAQAAEAVPSPALTLDPFGEQAAQAQAMAEEESKKNLDIKLDDSILSDAEKAQVSAFAQQIDLTSSSMILQYGAGAQKKMAEFSEGALDNVKTKDLGEAGGLLTDVMKELKGFDVDEEQKGLRGLFKKPLDQLETLKAKYTKAETNVNKICKALEAHQVTLLKDIATLDKMYELNLAYFKEITMYILAGRQKLEEVRNGQLKELIEKAEKSGLAEDAQAARDLASLCDRFEKKLYDLDLTRQISLQTAPQIRLIQSNDTMMVEKIQSTLVNTIPLWKSQMVLALGVEHSSQAAKAQREVTNVTNELLKKNADKLKVATIETAKESERGIVDIETLKKTNESLIATFDEVMKIQTEGRQKRQEAEEQMRRMEAELKQKLLEIHK